MKQRATIPTLVVASKKPPLGILAGTPLTATSHLPWVPGNTISRSQLSFAHSMRPLVPVVIQISTGYDHLAFLG